MNLLPQKLEEMEKTLRENNLMNAEDSVEEVEKGDYYPSIFNQVRGYYYFTHEKIIFNSGWGTHSFAVKYSDILSIEKSFVGPFMPFGVTLTVNEGENNSLAKAKYKLSLMSRGKWIDYISKKSGVTC